MISILEAAVSPFEESQELKLEVVKVQQLAVVAQVEQGVPEGILKEFQILKKEVQWGKYPRAFPRGAEVLEVVALEVVGHKVGHLPGNIVAGA